MAAKAFVIEVVIEPGEPLSGTLRVDGQQSETRFSGWVELMACISAIRTSGDPTSTEP
jgi:hypothetical protein